MSVPEVDSLGNPGGTATVDFRDWITRGSAVLRAVVDDGDRILERDENNNSMTRTLTCEATGSDTSRSTGLLEMARRPTRMSGERPGERPDLVVTSIALRPIPPPSSQPDLAVAGIAYDQNCALIVTVRNEGRGELTAETTTEQPGIQLFINDEPAGGFTEITRILQPGSSYPGRIGAMAFGLFLLASPTPPCLSLVPSLRRQWPKQSRSALSRSPS